MCQSKSAIERSENGIKAPADFAAVTESKEKIDQLNQKLLKPGEA